MSVKITIFSYRIFQAYIDLEEEKVQTTTYQCLNLYDGSYKTEQFFHQFSPTLEKSN